MGFGYVFAVIQLPHALVDRRLTILADEQLGVLLQFGSQAGDHVEDVEGGL
jgi:hypothetical protein